MAVEIRKSIEQILQCPICHDRLQDAKLLDCGHSFCKECLNAYVSAKGGPLTYASSFQCECPYCRKVVWIRYGDKTNLKVNFTVNAIIDALDSEERKPGPSEEMCGKHPDIEKKYVCERCNTNVCSECVILEHFNHGERPKSLQEIRKTATTEMERCDKWLADYHAYRERMEGIRSQGSQAFDSLESESSRRIALEKQAIEDRVWQLEREKARLENHSKDLTKVKEELTQKIISKNEAFNKQIDRSLQAETDVNVTANVSETCAKATRLLKRGRPIDIITVQRKYIKRLKENVALEIPSSRDAERALESVKALKVERGTSERDFYLTRSRARERTESNSSTDADVDDRVDSDSYSDDDESDDDAPTLRIIDDTSSDELAESYSSEEAF